MTVTLAKVTVSVCWELFRALGGGALERGTHRVVVEGYAILPCIEAYVTHVYPGYVTHMWKTWQHICAVA